jgi:hypothetical protein
VASTSIRNHCSCTSWAGGGSAHRCAHGPRPVAVATIAAEATTAPLIATPRTPNQEAARTMIGSTR